jgi:hypothetical protein
MISFLKKISIFLACGLASCAPTARNLPPSLVGNVNGTPSYNITSAFFPGPKNKEDAKVLANDVISQLCEIDGKLIDIQLWRASLTSLGWSALFTCRQLRID